MENNKKVLSGIVLYAKMPGKTSFSSLFTIKHAVNTKKVGHTGTLDSFASGLLVICTGALTRLAQYITNFSKEYQAIIKFGSQTDTLDPTGQVIKRTELPNLSDLLNAVISFTGNKMQSPPEYSAIHVNGKRASDIIREGKTVEMKQRPVTIYKAEVLEVVDTELKTLDLTNNNKTVQYARIKFEVSKGTYIRSLARDIALSIGSSAHLVGLIRTKIGNFKLEDAAGYKQLAEFTIHNVLSNSGVYAQNNEDELIKEIKDNIQYFTPEIANECDLATLIIKQEYENYFYNGKKLTDSMFIKTENYKLNFDMDSRNKKAVFTETGVFIGIVTFFDDKESSTKSISYNFVIPKNIQIQD